MNTSRGVLSLFLFSLCFGCAGRSGTLQTYTGVPRLQTEVAFLEAADHSWFSAQVSLEQVDTLSLGSSARASLLPGEHSVVIQYTGSRGNNQVVMFQRVVTFVAEAGHTYVVESDETGFFDVKYWYWIEDKATGEIVGGEKP